MIISTTQIKQLSEVAKVGSLKISSLNLSVSESALNMCIYRVENELGFQLFYRKNHCLYITEKSRPLFDLFYDKLARDEEFERKIAEIKEKSARQLRLAIQDSVAPYIIPELYVSLANNPHLEYSITQCDCISIVKRLVNDEIDFGIMLRGNKPDGFKEDILYQDRMVCYLSKSFAETGNFNPWHVISKNAILMPQVYYGQEKSTNNEEINFFDAINFDNLIRYVDLIDGYTLVPKMQMAYMNDEQRSRVRPILESHYQQRHVCLVYRKKRGHEQEYFLNLLTEAIADIVK